MRAHHVISTSPSKSSMILVGIGLVNLFAFIFVLYYCGGYSFDQCWSWKRKERERERNPWTRKGPLYSMLMMTTLIWGKWWIICICWTHFVDFWFFVFDDFSLIFIKAIIINCFNCKYWNKEMRDEIDFLVWPFINHHHVNYIDKN